MSYQGLQHLWITNRTTAPFYARRTFYISRNVCSAKVTVCGLGQFVLHMNGRRIGDHELDPGWTDYRRLIEYVTFDVRDDLIKGINVIGAEVGNGWYIKTDEHYTFAFPEFMPPNPNPYRPFGSCLVLALRLDLEYDDGTKEVIGSDDRFLVKEHPVVMSNVYGSETIDGRLTQPGWDTAGFDDTAWRHAEVLAPEEEPTGELIEQIQPPVRVVRTCNARFLHTVRKRNVPDCGGEISSSSSSEQSDRGVREIYDFGQNMAFLLEFEARGKRGDRIKVIPAEKLGEDRDIDTFAKGWCDVNNCVTGIIGQDDVWESFRMTFTYCAGRYAAVEHGSAEIRKLKAHAITSAWTTDGTFTCDDERYNRVYDMIRLTVESNMLSVHTDCPTIERFAWQEPNHLMAPAIFYMKDGRKLWEKFLLDLRVAQHTGEEVFLDNEGHLFRPGAGLVPSQAPCYIPNVLPTPGMGSFYDTIAWGSTCILGTRWHYLFYNDPQIISDNYDTGLRYLNYLKTRITPEGFLSHGLGDWGNPRGEFARENVETALLYADALTLAEFAGILGKTAEQRELSEYAETVRVNYNDRLLRQDPETGSWSYRVWGKDRMTQAVEALPLYWNMVPKDKEADVAAAFQRTLEEEGAFVSGEIGLPYIIQTAHRYDMDDLIAEYIMRTEHPGYYAFVLDGETTLGEYWETNPRSHCHDMLGHIIEWYYNGIAGICAQKPGFQSVCVKPYLPKGMHAFACTYHSASGAISVAVRETEKEILLEVTVPESMPCRLDTSLLERRGQVRLIRNTIGL